MSLSIEQLLDVIALRKAQSLSDWQTVIADEVANGELQRLQGQSVSDQQLYDMAIAYLQAPTPLVAQARIILEETRRLDGMRGGGTAATSSLDALAEYEASVISMDAAVVDAPDVEVGEGDVV